MATLAYFKSKYFAPRFFEANYFSEVAPVIPPVGGPLRYFRAKYFAAKYFEADLFREGTAVVVVPTLVILPGGGGEKKKRPKRGKTIRFDDLNFKRREEVIARIRRYTGPRPEPAVERQPEALTPDEAAARAADLALLEAGTASELDAARSELAARLAAEAAKREEERLIHMARVEEAERLRNAAALATIRAEHDDEDAILAILLSMAA